MIPMSRHGVLAMLLVLAGAAASADARAYCRTRTVATEPGFDPSEAGGCSQAGVPLFWRNSCVGYNTHDPPSKKISYDDASNLISIAFTRWTGATCPTGGAGRSRPSIDVRDLGPASCEAIQYKSGVPNQNVIVFRDSGWKHGSQVLGLTIVTFSPENGEIYGADMEMNMQDTEPLALRDPVAPSEYDFLAIATHEAGHFLGIAHSEVKPSTMSASYKAGETFQRNLSSDDIAAVCETYRPNGDRAVLTGKVSAAPGCDPTPRGGFSRECAEVTQGCARSSVARPVPRGTWPTLGVAALAVVRLARRYTRRAAHRS